MKLLKEEITNIIKEELENVLLENWFSQLSDKVKSSLGLQKPEDVQKLPDPMRRRLIQGMCAIGIAGLGSACQDYELQNYPDKNLENMTPPDCVGSIDLIFDHYDFEEGGIPEEFFMEQFKGIEGVEVQRDTGEQIGIDDLGIDHSIRVLYKNVPFDSPSIESLGIKELLSSQDLYVDLINDTPFLIRSIAFYFPVLDGNVLANQKQLRCITTNQQNQCDSWSQHGAWDFTAPIGTPREDVECEKKYREFIKGPLKKPEEELNETKRSKLRSKSRKSNRRKIRRRNRTASTKRLG